MAFWKKPLRLGLQARISLLAALGLVLIFTFMIWEERQIADANAEMALRERLNLARVIAQHLDQDLDRTLSRLEQVAAFPTINLEDGDLEPEKAELRALYRPDYFSYVFLLDKDGLVLWTEPYLPEVVGTRGMDCPHVQETLRTGQPAIAPVAHALTPLSPVIAPVMPIRNQQGVIVGALGAAIDPSSPPYVSIFEGMSPGNTGYIQLVDENGIVLANTQRQRLFQKSEHADLFISLLEDNKPAIATYTVTEENNGTSREIIAFAPLTLAPWGVAVEQAEAEFLALSLEASRRMETFAVIAVAAALLLTWVTTLSVTRPVRKLMAASERLAAGDLSTPVPPLGKDEIGELGRRFEEMRVRLARWGEELEAAVQQRTRQLATLYAIDRAAAQSLELDEILNASLDKVLETLEVEAGGIFLLEADGETMTLGVHRGLSDEFVENVQRIRLGEGISGRAAAERQVVVLDVADYPTERLAPVIIQAGFQTLASTPLLSAGELVGALNVGTRRPRAFPPEEMELLTSIGQQLGGAVANARLHQETRRRAERLADMLQLGIELAARREESVILDVLVTRTAILADSPTCTVMLVDETTEEAVLAAHYGLPEDTPPGLRVPLTLPLIQRSLESGEPILLADIDRNAVEMRAILVRRDIQAFFAYPMIWEGRALGFLTLSSLAPRRPSAEEVTSYRLLAERAAAALVNARLYAQVQQELIERERAEVALRETSDYLDNLLDYANAPIIVWDPKFRINRFNHAFEHLTGHTFDQVRGQELAVLFPDTSREESLRNIERTSSGEYWESVEIPILCQNGEIRLVLWNSANLYGEDGATLVATIAQGQDITERRQAEQALRASEQEYRTLVENATELIWMHDTEGRFTYVNRQAEKVSGHKLEDWLGQNFAPLIAPPQDLPRIQQIVLETLAGKPQSYEVGVYRADGSIFHLSVNTTPLYRDGVVIGTISFGRDVSAQQEAEAALTQRMAELSALFSVSSALRGAKSVAEILPIILEQTARVIGADGGSIFLAESESGEFVCHALYPLPGGGGRGGGP